MEREAQATTSSKSTGLNDATRASHTTATSSTSVNAAVLLTTAASSSSTAAAAAAPVAAASTSESPDDATTTTTKFLPLPLPILLTGKFDLYSTQLSFLRPVYLSKMNGTTTPNFQAVHSKILIQQARPDFSMRCALREDMLHAKSSSGRFECDKVIHPLTEELLEPFRIFDGKTKPSVKFDSKQSAHHSTVGTGWGYEAKIELDRDDAEWCRSDLIRSAKGTFKLRKVWAAPALVSGENMNNGVGSTESELFECYWAIKVVYGAMLRRNGYASGSTFGGSFWAVRALKKDGEEVGIDPGDGLYASTSVHGFISHVDDVGDGNVLDDPEDLDIGQRWI